MSRFVQSSLILATSIAITALVMAIVFPVHALGGAAQRSAFDDVRPAVFVEGAFEGSGTPGSQPTCPFVAQRGSADACPYLSRLDARAGRSWVRTPHIPVVSGGPCPYLSAMAASCGCPYLAGEESHAARRGNSPDELSL